MLGDHDRDDKRVDLFEFKKALPLLVRECLIFWCVNVPS